MSNVQIGEKLRVYIQRANGEVQEVAGDVKQLEIYQNSDVHRMLGGETYTVPTTVETRLTLIGNHYALTNDVEIVENAKTAIEWRCDHCQSANLREYLECNKCGFPRPFLYGL
jgi:hypothetical protein